MNKKYPVSSASCSYMKALRLRLTGQSLTIISDIASVWEPFTGGQPFRNLAGSVAILQSAGASLTTLYWLGF